MIGIATAFALAITCARAESDGEEPSPDHTTALPGESATTSVKHGPKINGSSAAFYGITIGFGVFILLLAAMAVIYVFWRRRSTLDPYADTPLPSLESIGLGSLRGGSGRSGRPGGVGWERLGQEEHMPLTAAFEGSLDSPENSPRARGRFLDSDDEQER